MTVFFHIIRRESVNENNPTFLFTVQLGSCRKTNNLIILQSCNHNTRGSDMKYLAHFNHDRSVTTIHLYSQPPGAAWAETDEKWARLRVERSRLMPEIPLLLLCFQTLTIPAVSPIFSLSLFCNYLFTQYPFDIEQKVQCQLDPFPIRFRICSVQNDLPKMLGNCTWLMRMYSISGKPHLHLQYLQLA